jgi:putative tricarboxylic transport membrane protein
MSEGPGGSEAATGSGRGALRQKSAEIVVAAVFLLLGAIVVYDSVRLGYKWGDDGPQAGYFPFYIGALVCGSALINMLVAFFKVGRDEVFVELGKLKLVLTVLIPAFIYVALISWLGIYVASALFVAFFMRWLGKYPWWKAAAVSIGNSVFFFLIFEMWFKVPLPKGPLESLLGLN